MKLKNKLRRVFCMTLIIMVMVPNVCANALSFTPISKLDDDGNPVDLKLYSEAAFMMNYDTGETIVDINADDERVPASLTKIMTAVVLLDKISDEEELKNTKVSAGTEAFDELYDTGASTADIQPNEEVSYYDLLCALMIPSACEAANIIAYNVSDSIPNFCKLMNKKAEDLDMTHTHYSNAHGLWANKNYSSCRDIATLCKYALDKYPVFKEIVGMNDYTMTPTDIHPDGTYIYNTNLMLNDGTDYYYQYVKGIKTGSLDEAGRCLASYASYDGTTYLTVTMGATMDKQKEDIEKGQKDPDSIYGADVVYYNIIDHIKMYDWAYDYLIPTDFVNPESELRDVKVMYGKDLDYANLKPANGFNRLWPSYISTDEVTSEITVKDNVVAPVEVGDVLGEMKLTYKGEVISTIDLVSTTKVERSKVSEKTEIAKSYFGSKPFYITIAVVAGVIVIYTIIHVVRVQKKYLK